ncbi:MAG TPA: hypothetical protein VEU06_01315 [Micropepsaceae bacterium]|nr:hypothetical protein [Micropepsaceae bacterium]
MRLRDVPNRLRSASVVASAALTVAAFTAVAAMAADIPVNSLKLAAGVVAAKEGYETPPTSYVVANPTSTFSDHFYFDTKATGDLKRGDKVDALAKVKGYDWILVGRNGTGIGYVPISMLSPADQYHP